MGALTKAMLSESLIKHLLLTKEDAKNLVNEFFEEIRVGLENGSHVKLSGFGNFILRDKIARPGRNPKNGLEIPVSARRVVTFKTGLKLKKVLETVLKDE